MQIDFSVAVNLTNFVDIFDEGKWARFIVGDLGKQMQLIASRKVFGAQLLSPRETEIRVDQFIY